MNEQKYEGRRFICASCKKPAISKFAVEECMRCRTRVKNHRKCTNCQKTFFSSVGKSLCRWCFELQAPTNPYQKRKEILYAQKISPQASKYVSDIKILIVKARWNVLNNVDLFKIANIYMECFNDENKYSTLDPNEQIQYMLIELKKTLAPKFEGCLHSKNGHVVEKLNDKGIVIATYVSVIQASKKNGINHVSVRKACKTGQTISRNNTLFRFRYKS